jgi:hypothetical protein
VVFRSVAEEVVFLGSCQELVRHLSANIKRLTKVLFRPNRRGPEATADRQQRHQAEVRPPHNLQPPHPGQAPLRHIIDSFPDRLPSFTGS